MTRNLSARLIRSAAAAAALLIPWDAALAGDEATILSYHRIADAERPSASVDAADFARHLAEIEKHGRPVVRLEDTVNALADDRDLPDGALAIAFDGAYDGVLEHAAPLLLERGWPFTVFVSSRAVDGGLADRATWAELRALAADPLVDLGAHGHAHADMTALSRAEAIADLRLNRERIAVETGVVAKLLSYPWGLHDAEARSAARAVGFRAALAQDAGVAHRGADPMALPTIAFAGPFHDLDHLRLALTAAPFPTEDAVPEDGPIGPADNPPALGFTAAAEIAPIAGVRCFAAGQGEAEVQVLGGFRVEARFAEPFPPGRTRVACIAPTPDYRWRWYGKQFDVVPDAR